MKRFFQEYWSKLLFLLLIFAAALRMGNLFGALDYDEIWTMSYFSSRGIKAIFTELALPNNQPLNSLLVKFAMLLELPFWGIRLHSLAAGVLAVMLIIPLGRILTGSRNAGFWSGVFLAFSAPAAVYSQLARGYELQLFFLLLFADGLAFCRFKKWRYLAPAALIAGGVGSILTLPTSVIYLGVITCSVFIIRPRLPGKAVIAVLLGGVIFSAVWYGVNFRQFQSGQQFGNVISSHLEFFKFAFNTLDPLIPLAWCPFLIAGLISLPNRKAATVFGGIICVLLTALLTRGGPARVYIPLVAWTALLCGAGTDQICRKLSARMGAAAACIAVCCCAVGFYYGLPAWNPPDWYGIFDAGSSKSEDTLVVYSGTSGFPVMWNNQPKSLEDNAARITNADKLQKLFCFAEPGILNGVNSAFNEQQIKLDVKGVKEVEGTVYGLKPLAQPAAGDEVILLTVNEEKSIDSTIAGNISKTGDFLRLNVFFEQPSADGRVNVIRGGRIKDPALFKWENLPETIKIFKITP